MAERQAAWGQLKEGRPTSWERPYRLTVLRGATGAVTLNGQEIRVPLPAGADLWSRLGRLVPGAGLEAASGAGEPFCGLIWALRRGRWNSKAWKRRWGECHPDGTLKFNWRLILCPPAVIDYVVVHELAHLKVAGHNPRFWGQVAKVLPDYAARRRWLNREGAPFLLWRA